jgi:hypothetical protein
LAITEWREKSEFKLGYSMCLHITLGNSSLSASASYCVYEKETVIHEKGGSKDYIDTFLKMLLVNYSIFILSIFLTGEKFKFYSI